MATQAKRRTQKKKADRLFSLYIRARDKRCVQCGTTEMLQCAHGFTRSYLSTRWDPRNAWALCSAHHVFYTHRPLEWDEWMRERMGEEEYEEVRQLALSSATSMWKPDYEAIIYRLEKALK